MLETPWKIKNHFFKWVIFPYVRLIFFVEHIPWGQNWQIFGVPIIQKHRRATMRFGNHLSLRSSAVSNPLGPNHPVILSTREPGALLKIGDNFAMTGGAICVAEKVIIGNNVAIGANSTVVDTDFHPLNSEYRRLHPQEAITAPVIIEDDVFIGMNCLILKGVTIGRGSVIGAGSVVTKDVPPFTIVAGNPARELRKI